jgi:hypothetical protein
VSAAATLLDLTNGHLLVIERDALDVPTVVLYEMTGHSKER